MDGGMTTQPSHPIIGMTCGLSHNKAGIALSEISQAYVLAIQTAGGTPLIIPNGVNSQGLRELIGRLDGVLLTGGGDIAPSLFQGEEHPKVYGVSPERDQLELALVRQTVVAKRPLLAICRGIQALNVAFGGTLYTHIAAQLPNALKHDYFPGYPRNHHAHTVSLQSGSLLQEIFGAETIPVNSLHHQGIARVGEGLEAIAFAPDGLVEGLAVTDVPFALGVQWHPECLPEDTGMRSLFRAFIEACG